MTDTRTVHDPFLKKDVEVSNRLVDRLRGKYACGPVQENGEPEFGWRQFDTPPIQHEAADEIERLSAIQPQQMRDALVSYRFAQKWATGTEEHRLAIQVADAINPLPPWYEIETPSHTRPQSPPSEKTDGSQS